MSEATCKHCDAPVSGSYARARSCKNCQKARRKKRKADKGIPDWLSKALREFVVEGWEADDGGYVVLVCKHGEDTQRRGSGQTFKDAVADAIACWKEFNGCDD